MTCREKPKQGTQRTVGQDKVEGSTHSSSYPIFAIYMHHYIHPLVTIYGLVSTYLVWNCDVMLIQLSLYP